MRRTGAATVGLTVGRRVTVVGLRLMMMLLSPEATPAGSIAKKTNE